MTQTKLISDEDFERAWDRLFTRDPQLPSVPAAAPRADSSFKLEDIVRASIKELRDELGKSWLPNRVFGTRLHASVAKNIEAAASPKGWVIRAEQPLRTFDHLPRRILGMSLANYVAGPGAHLAWLKDELARVMKMDAPIGNLQPDLVIQTPDRVATIWDLTSRQRVEHVAKTVLYANVLARPNRLVRIGETYWLRRGGF